jgi:hypothetical protein
MGVVYINIYIQQQKNNKIEEPKNFVMRPILAIRGDHITPVPVKAHNYDPQPVLLHSRYRDWDGLERFTVRGQLRVARHSRSEVSHPLDAGQVKMLGKLRA